MIKVESGAATREPVPVFLVGVSQEALADLSWTDPALGVSEAGWWPEDDQSPELDIDQQYGEETLTVDTENQKVICVKAVVADSDENIAERKANLSIVERAKRDLLLAETDWVVIKSLELGETVSTDMSTYRQALRDVPAQAGFPDTITWPTQPE
tara:strand:- start:166 stop:630 length:465 start_codon:yes stop_codon:yes gene_type:complete